MGGAVLGIFLDSNQFLPQGQMSLLLLLILCDFGQRNLNMEEDKSLILLSSHCHGQVWSLLKFLD